MTEFYIPTDGDPWCDADGDERREITIAYASGKTVTLATIEGQVLWTQALPEPLLYLRLSDGVIVGQGHDSGDAYAITKDSYDTFDKAHGQDCVAVRSGKLYVMRPPNGTAYDVIDLSRRFVSVTTVPCPPTSQGFRDILPDGTVVFGDKQFTMIVAGRTVVRPMRRGQFTIGQSDVSATGAEVLTPVGPSGFVLFKGAAVYEPHVAQRNYRYVFCARTNRGAAFAVVDPPYPPNELYGATPAPTPTPHPTPEPSPMADHRDVVQRIHSDVSLALGPIAGNLERCFEVVKRVAWELRAEVGLLEKPGGENIVNWRGVNYSASRVCYPDGRSVKILSDVPATAGPQWNVEEPVAPPQRYRPAQEPEALPGGSAPGPTPPTIPPTQPPAPPQPRTVKASIRIGQRFLACHWAGVPGPGHILDLYLSDAPAPGIDETWTIETIG